MALPCLAVCRGARVAAGDRVRAACVCRVASRQAAGAAAPSVGAEGERSDVASACHPERKRERVKKKKTRERKERVLC